MAENVDHLDATFGQKVKAVIANGYTTVGISIGVNLGLFDLLADFKEPKTSQEIADAGGFKERYIREWLGGMVCGEIVEVTGDKIEKFFISKSRAPYLVCRQSEGFSAMAASHLLAGVKPYDDLLQCFKLNGPRGIPLEKYGGESGINQSRKRLTALWCKKYLIQDVINNVPNLHRKLEEGIQVLDVACGVGMTTYFLAGAYPASTFTAFDISKEAIQHAKTKSDQFSNVCLHCYDAIDLPKEWTNQFDYVFIKNVIHDLPFPDKALKEFYRVLKSPSNLTVIDCFSHPYVHENMKLPESKMRYVSSLIHCMPSSLSFDGGFGLGAMAGNETIKKIIEEAGFTVTVVRLISDSRCLFVCCKD